MLYTSEHLFDGSLNIFIWNTEYPKASLIELFRSFLVICLLRLVNTSIDFENDSLSHAAEIHNERTEGNLPFEFKSRKLAVAYGPPKDRLRAGHPLAQFFRKGELLLFLAGGEVGAWHAPRMPLPPAPLLGRQERGALQKVLNGFRLPLFMFHGSMERHGAATS